MLRLPTTKRISFEDYKKFFRNAVNSTEILTQVFYRLTTDSIIFDFQFQNYSYIIECEVPFNVIAAMYQETEAPNDTSVITEGRDDNPIIAKFVIEFLNNRAVRDISKS